MGLRYNRDTEKNLDNSGLLALYPYFIDHENLIEYKNEEDFMRLKNISSHYITLFIYKEGDK